jgi:NAD(P)-dependent dehydrogenase (short-subunit alcohol dehydrogenase family)
MSVFLVTGGARGIGAGIAARLVKDGASVIIADKEATSLPGARGVVCDVSREDEVQSLIDGVARTENGWTGLSAMPVS